MREALGHAAHEHPIDPCAARSAWAGSRREDAAEILPAVLPDAIRARGHRLRPHRRGRLRDSRGERAPDPRGSDASSRTSAGRSRSSSIEADSARWHDDPISHARGPRAPGACSSATAKQSCEFAGTRRSCGLPRPGARIEAAGAPASQSPSERASNRAIGALTPLSAAYAARLSSPLGSRLRLVGRPGRPAPPRRTLPPSRRRCARCMSRA